MTPLKRAANGTGMGLTSSGIWRFLVLGLLALVYLCATWSESLVVDGTRYFWLDDDQMISMRYAKHFAEGHGLVWNLGERVEGYTNFLWTVVMAGVHLLGIPEAKVALVVKLLNLALLGGILGWSERLLKYFCPHPGLALPAVWVALAFSVDLVFWAVNGFETTALIALYLLVTVRILEEHPRQIRASTFLLMGVVPLIRSDATYVWACCALLALGLSRNKGRTLLWVLSSLLAFAVHLAWRWGYYGEWLPNTYFLKVAGLEGRLELGARYLARFVTNYGVPLVVALGGAVASRDRRQLLIILGVPLAGVYTLTVGGDMFPYSRFLAFLVPVLVVLAAVAAVAAARGERRARNLLLLAVVMALWSQVGVLRPQRLASGNGFPRQGLIAGLTIRRWTQPAARVAVIAAGAAPYFSHRGAIDLLGRCDRHVARVAAGRTSFVGHNKVDPEYSLNLDPDLVVLLGGVPEVREALRWSEGEYHRSRLPWYTFEIARHSGFRERYLKNAISFPSLGTFSIFARSDSQWVEETGRWSVPQIGE